MTVVTVTVVIFATVVILTVVTVAVGTLVIVTYFSKNNLTPRQQMRYSQGSFSQLSRCFFLHSALSLWQTRTIQYRRRLTGRLEWPEGPLKFWSSSLPHFKLTMLCLFIYLLIYSV